MIIEKAQIDTYLELADADSEGFLLVSDSDDNDSQRVWLSWEHLDDLVRITDALREVNDAAEEST